MKKVIYIDDEPMNLRIFEKIFCEDFSIITFESPVEALEYLSKNKVDVICSDQQMPKMNGTQFFKKLLSNFNNKNQKKILITGYSMTEEIENAINKGIIDEFVRKPWDSDKLRELILE